MHRSMHKQARTIMKEQRATADIKNKVYFFQVFGQGFSDRKELGRREWRREGEVKSS